MDTYFFIVLYSLKIRPFHDKRYSIVVQFRFKKKNSYKVLTTCLPDFVILFQKH